MSIESNQFIETESSLIRKNKDFLIANKKEVIMIDLGENISIFRWFISSNFTWESDTVMYKTESLLNKIAAAHKEYDNGLIEQMLRDAAQRMRNISKGGMISNVGYEYLIAKAIELKDITEVEMEDSIKYLKNPYYEWSKEDFINRKEIYKTLINQKINETITDKNYQIIRMELVDYDLNQKKITKVLLSNNANLSTSTIKNYLNKYPELNDIYEVIRINSGTLKQLKAKEYNKNKTLKENSYNLLELV
jgi:hypothetical protein